MQILDIFTSYSDYDNEEYKLNLQELQGFSAAKALIKRKVVQLVNAKQLLISYLCITVNFYYVWLAADHCFLGVISNPLNTTAYLTLIYSPAYSAKAGRYITNGMGTSFPALLDFQSG